MRRWEVAYLSILAVGMAGMEIADISYRMWLERHRAENPPDVFTVADLATPLWMPEYLISLALTFLVFALPYVPFLFWTGAIPDRVLGKKKPVSASGGVRDRELDG